MNADLATPAMSVAVVVAAAGLAVSAAEDLRTFAVFRDDGLLAWPVARLRAPWLERGRLARAFDAVFAGDRYQRVLVATGAAALAAPVVLVRPAVLPLVAGVLLVLVMMQALRSLYGMDGSDQMNLVLLSGATAWGLAPPGSTVRSYAAWFVAAQLALAYFVAGVAKTTSPQWRRGTALTGVMSTGHYGDPRLYRLLVRFPWLSFVLGWTVMLLEVSFPLVFVLPTGPRLVLFGAMAAFHLGCAAFMGLNNFLFAFVAAYPVAWSCAAASAASLAG